MPKSGLMKALEKRIEKKTGELMEEADSADPGTFDDKKISPVFKFLLLRIPPQERKWSQ